MFLFWTYERDKFAPRYFYGPALDCEGSLHLANVVMWKSRFILEPSATYSDLVRHCVKRTQVIGEHVAHHHAPVRPDGVVYINSTHGVDAAAAVDCSV
jgi:hypothetical protein